MEVWSTRLHSNVVVGLVVVEVNDLYNRATHALVLGVIYLYVLWLVSQLDHYLSAHFIPDKIRSVCLKTRLLFKICKIVVVEVRVW